MRRGWGSEIILSATLGSVFAVGGVQVKITKVRTEEAQLRKGLTDPKAITITLSLISKVPKCRMEHSKETLMLA